MPYTDPRSLRLEAVAGELREPALPLVDQPVPDGRGPDLRRRPWTHDDSPEVLPQPRLQALFDGALNAILLANDEGAYVDANPAACALVGYSRDELLRMSVHDLLAQSQNPQETWQRFIDARRQVGRTTLRRKDGSLVVVDFMATTDIQPGLHLSVLEDAATRLATEQSLITARQQLQDLAAHQQERLDEIRGELARDLHDELGQLLGALRVEADLVAAAAPAAAERMRLLLSECTATVRDLSRAQRPAALDLGLVPALRALALDFSRRGDIDIDLQLQTRPTALAVPVVAMLFRVAQEALGNAVRHSGAQRITLSLLRRGDLLVLQVEDDGQGFDVEQAMQGRGLGLVGMRERANCAGARFELRSQAGEGSCMTLSLCHPITGGAA